MTSPRLTERQREVLACVVEGLANKEIASRLSVSLQTVKWHVSKLLLAHGVETRASLVREALQDPGESVRAP